MKPTICKHPKVRKIKGMRAIGGFEKAQSMCAD